MRFDAQFVQAFDLDKHGGSGGSGDSRSTSATRSLSSAISSLSRASLIPIPFLEATEPQTTNQLFDSAATFQSLEPDDHGIFTSLRGILLHRRLDTEG
nr:hypothetical protein CFP56_64707 [Quercus suber]